MEEIVCKKCGSKKCGSTNCIEYGTVGEEKRIKCLECGEDEEK